MEHMNSHEAADKAVGFLVCPEVIQFVDFRGLPALRLVCKTVRDVIDKTPQEIGYWKAVCNSYCYYAGIYSHSRLDTIMRTDYQKHFFSALWTIRDKWAVDGSELSSGQEYKIKVASRFRPGELQSDKVCLPLHQFLKVKRHQRAEQAKSSGEASAVGDILVGEQDPEEFLDPLLGTLMKEPVLLTSSNRVVDRSVAVQCIVRGGKDPFNNERLSLSMLVPQEELSARIQEFRVRKQQRDVALGLDELKPLVSDGNAVNADLLDALREVERINQAVRKAELDASKATAATDAAGEQGWDAQNAQGAEEAVPETDPLLAAVVEEAAVAAGEVEGAHPDFTHFSATDVEGHYNHISKKVERAGIVEINAASSTVCMHVPGVGVRPFHYAAVHKGEANQQAVYERSAQDAVASVLNGFNACVMCYGQTGSGKTYTFFGPEDTLFRNPDAHRKKHAESHGVVLRACEELLRAQTSLASVGISVTFTAQFVEIYEEQVTDLFTGHAATIRRETGQVAGALEMPFDSMEQVVCALRTGHERKKFAATEMNDRSSRSHTALIVHVTQKLAMEKFAQSAQSDTSGRCASLLGCVAAGGDKLIRSQLHLVDLAGSERVKKSKVEGVRLREAVGINSSLMVLGKVIAALVQGKSHVPYFESKLTTMLKAAFGGNSRTTVVVNCRTDGDSGDETLQSMRFGERCAMISNSMRIAASSYQSALAAVDHALGTVQAQLASLEARGKQQLPSYKALLHSYQALGRKRFELAGIDASASAVVPKAQD